MADLKLNAAQINEYWKTRMNNAYLAGEANLSDSLKTIKDAYTLCGERITTELNSFYQKYAEDGKISLADAQKILNTNSNMTPTMANEKQQASYAKALSNYKVAMLTGGDVDKAISELKLASSRANVTRLQSLMSKINGHLTETTAKVDKTVGDTLIDTYQAKQMISAYTYKETTGVSVNFGEVGGKGLETVAKMKWLGGNYSDRIWDNKAKLMQSLETLIPQAFVRGNGSSDLARLIQEKMNTSYSNANRLARTELNFVSNQASKDFYKKLENSNSQFNRYEYLATLDNRTSEICGELDGQVFEFSKAEVGVNFPPMHPYCRSTTIPYFDDDSLYAASPRVQRDLKTGKSVIMTDKMTFDEWVELNANDYQPLYKSKPKLFKGLQVQSIVKPPIDWKSWTSLTEYTLMQAKGDVLDGVLKNLNLQDRDATEIVDAMVQYQMSKSTLYSREGLMAHSDILGFAKRLNILTDDDVTVTFGKTTYKDSSKAFKLDMLVDGLTQKQAYNRYWTGHAVEDWDEYLKAQQPYFDKDIGNLINFRYAILKKWKSYANSTIKDAKMLPSFTKENEGPQGRMGTEEIFKQMDKIFTPLYKNDLNGKTWMEAFSSKKNLSTSLWQEVDFYTNALKNYLPALKGISTEYLVKYAKGKFKTIDEAKEAYQNKEAEYKIKAQQKSIIDMGLSTEQFELDGAEFWDDYENPSELDKLVDSTELPYDDEEADKTYRPWTSIFWAKSTQSQRRAAYTYTSGSGKFNRPLEGYLHRWSDFQPTKSLESLMVDGSMEEMFDLYDAVKLAKIPKAIRVTRGGSMNELFGTTGILGTDSSGDIERHIGSTVTINRFLSTGVARGKGFGGDVQYEIVLPKGTQALYVEPFSAYSGGNDGLQWKGSPKYNGRIGGEQEIIVQAGTQYIVQNIKKVNGRTKVTMVAIPRSQQGLPKRLAETNIGKERVQKGEAVVSTILGSKPIKSGLDAVPDSAKESSMDKLSGIVNLKMTNEKVKKAFGNDSWDLKSNYSNLYNSTKQLLTDIADKTNPTPEEMADAFKIAINDSVVTNVPSIVSDSKYDSYDTEDLWVVIGGKDDDDLDKKYKDYFKTGVSPNEKLVQKTVIDNLKVHGTLYMVGEKGKDVAENTAEVAKSTLNLGAVALVKAKINPNICAIVTAKEFSALNHTTIQKLENAQMALDKSNDNWQVLEDMINVVKTDPSYVALLNNIDGIYLEESSSSTPKVLMIKKNKMMVNENYIKLNG